MCRGFPDYVIVTNKAAFLIEMKRKKHSNVTPEQKEWIKAFIDVGITTYVTKGFDEAKRIVDTYMGE